MRIRIRVLSLVDYIIMMNIPFQMAIIVFRIIWIVVINVIMDISNIKLINRALNAFFLSVLLLVLSISCISNEGNDIELKLSKTDFEEYSFNEIIKDYYTVQLETTTDNLLGNIIRLYVSGSRIFAWDLGQNIVFIFDRQGKYIG